MQGKLNVAFRDEVYKVVQSIPEGRVLTYGQVAQILGRGRWARQVGWALHANRDPNVPCHRVVDRNGRLAPNFAFDGWREQKRRLLTEGVKFRDNMHVNLERNLWH